jgi:hypothetical protein
MPNHLRIFYFYDTYKLTAPRRSLLRRVSGCRGAQPRRTMVRLAVRCEALKPRNTRPRPRVRSTWGGCRAERRQAGQAGVRPNPTKEIKK